MVLRYRPSGLPSDRIDFIEKAGTGIRRIRDGAKAVDCPEPAFGAGNFATVIFRPNPEVRRAAGGELGPTPQVTGEVAGEVTGEVAGEVAPQVVEEVSSRAKLFRAMFREMTRHEIQEALGLKHEDHFRSAHLLPSLDAGLIEMTIPDKPRSRLQRYRLTAAGRRFLRRTTPSNTKVRR